MVLAAASVQAVPQSGSPIYSTQTFYFGGDCTGTADGEATFGAANLCQPLRTVLGTVTSVDVISVEAGCTGKSGILMQCCREIADGVIASPFLHE